MSSMSRLRCTKYFWCTVLLENSFGWRSWSGFGRPDIQRTSAMTDSRNLLKTFLMRFSVRGNEFYRNSFEGDISFRFRCIRYLGVDCQFVELSRNLQRVPLLRFSVLLHHPEKKSMTKLRCTRGRSPITDWKRFTKKTMCEWITISYYWSFRYLDGVANFRFEQNALNNPSLTTFDSIAWTTQERFRSQSSCE